MDQYEEGIRLVLDLRILYNCINHPCVPLTTGLPASERSDGSSLRRRIRGRRVERRGGR